MKALVLSGGHGTRMRPITHTSAKQLIPIANRPVLFYGLDALKEAGITEVGIVVGDTADEVMNTVGDGSRWGLEITYIQQDAPRGLAHCVLISKDFLQDDDFVLYLGDNFIVNGITGVVDEFRQQRPDAHILLTKVEDPSRFGVAELNPDGTVRKLVEKPKEPRSDLAIVGVYLFTPKIHDAVNAIRPSKRGELEITDAMQWLLDHGHDVRSHEITGYWKDTGQVEDMLECNRMVLETFSADVRGDLDEESTVIGRVVIHETAQIRRSHLVGPLVIGAGAKVSDSYIGPFTSIGDGCELADTEVESSIVMDRSTIRGVHRVQDSLIGRDVHVMPARDVPRTHQLVLGDHSRVRIVR
ncbi:glucose-1-phosphate thymidylyltransferase [Lentzea sp. NBRC 105346]|uniref:glucose-1-phosphate thymidylyltransferase n=1 Tax=Lentzea sp. NBRC 105346 TaxID=3032205 RepID=UPI0024A431DC|nr:glucose-1-phosphate thymidylyltransferase [Lentzea sp. NBRC 105346]GLZ36315.1 glucose-1-phosphate thymidylyltransferase [Lentzea sp. NBRC 105346]